MASISSGDAALIAAQTGPAQRLLIRLGQPPYRNRVFSGAESLAKEARLPAGARALFRFDSFQLPRACEPAGSSPDIVAMIDALAERRAIDRLPSHAADPHPLGYLVERIRLLGGWGNADLNV